MYYKLDENKNVTECTLEEWMTMIKSGCRHISENDLGDYIVSTVFLGLNHSINDKPEFFETMLYNKKDNQFLDYQARYSTYDEAIDGHQKAIDWFNGGMKDDYRRDIIATFIDVLKSQSATKN